MVPHMRGQMITYRRNTADRLALIAATLAMVAAIIALTAAVLLWM